MLSRRKFIKEASSALALTGLATVSRGLAPKAIPQPGVQLFTYFNSIDNDVEGTLKKVAETGVRNIESAFSRKGDYYGLSAKTFSKLLKDLGMTWRSQHVFGAPRKKSGE